MISSQCFFVFFVFVFVFCFFIFTLVSHCKVFIVSTSVFRSWMVLLRSFSCLFVFSCNSLRDFCVYSFMTSARWTQVLLYFFRGLLHFLLIGFYLLKHILLNFFK